jgi:hypothetical protein
MRLDADQLSAAAAAVCCDVGVALLSVLPLLRSVYYHAPDVFDAG